MGKAPNFSIILTDDELAAFEQLARQARPDMERGGKSALFREWLYAAAESAGIEIEDKTVYGAPEGNQRAVKKIRK